MHNNQTHRESTMKAIASSLIIVATMAACAPEVKIVSVEPSTANFTDRGQQTKIVAKTLDLTGEEIAGVPISFRSDNTAVVEVSSDGYARPVASGSAMIVASTDTGKQGQVFVKVCLPEKIACVPQDVLNLRVGTASPLKCELKNCRDETVQGTLEYIEDSKDMVFKDGDNTFVGKVVGNTKVTVKGGGLEKVVSVVIGEQIFAPGMGPGSGGGGGGGMSNEEQRNKDPYDEGGGGQFNHILKNMKM